MTPERLALLSARERARTAFYDGTGSISAYLDASHALHRDISPFIAAMNATEGSVLVSRERLPWNDPPDEPDDRRTEE